MHAHEAGWPAAVARTVADELLAALEPRRERICVAGSLRRGKPGVGDIEILYVPRIGQVRLLGELFPRQGSLADELIEQWVTKGVLTKGVLTKRVNVRGVTTWGAQNKLAVHYPSGIAVDLFATDAERWFVALVVRTGSPEMNIRLADAAKKRGMRFEAYGVLLGTSGEKIITHLEWEVFERLGVPYREAAQR